MRFVRSGAQSPNLFPSPLIFLEAGTRVGRSVAQRLLSRKYHEYSRPRVMQMLSGYRFSRLFLFSLSPEYAAGAAPGMSLFYRTPPDREETMPLRNRKSASSDRVARFGVLLFALLCTAALGTASALAQTLTTFYSFTGGTDGANPQAGLVADAAGNLYGTTLSGGDLSTCNGYGCGVVFEVTPSSKTESVLHSFTGGSSDGADPEAGLIIDPSGKLYGTTLNGGPNTCFGASCGVVFEVTPSSKSETVLHSFTGGTDGGLSLAGLMADSSFNLYGTTQGGGTTSGTVFELVNSSGSYNTLNVLYSFSQFSNPGNGYIPAAGLIADSSNNLYGTTTSGGGTGCGGYGCGVVFKLTPPTSSGAWTETPIYSFLGGSDGSDSHAGLIEDSAGNLYGTTIFGGDSNCQCGVVFKITSSGTESVLHAFTGGGDGGSPSGDLIQDAAGNLYGMTATGGDLSASACFGLGYGCGVVFKITPSGSYTVLYTFTAGNDGGFPEGSLIADASGNLYGTTAAGGAHLYYGTVFELSGTGFVPASSSFMGVPGKPNCQGVSIATLTQTYGGLGHAAASLGYSSVATLQSTVANYCAQ